MKFLLLLFQLTEAQTSTLITAAASTIGGALLALLGQRFLWPKTQAETRKLDSETEQNYQKMRLDLANSLDDWIKRFNAANIEIIAKEDAFETQLTAMQAELDACVKAKASCQELKSRMSNMLYSLGQTLAGTEIDNGLLSEMREMQRQLGGLGQPE